MTIRMTSTLTKSSARGLSRWNQDRIPHPWCGPSRNHRRWILEYWPGLSRAWEDLASTFEVHLMDRRGRGMSGPQGMEYSIAKEVEDLHALVAATGASRVFGHSYGGLAVLETARQSDLFTKVVVYEPGSPSRDRSLPRG